VNRLLLDTHVLLWALLQPDRIPQATLATIRSPATDVVVSAATAWEIATKHRLGRLDEASGVVAGYAEHLTRLRADELAITSGHALSAGALRWSHRDPFDRILAAQSILGSVPLVTNDRALTTFPEVHTIW
jgi:PIN domain nuclease of toxin-antitoxin system